MKNLIKYLPILLLPAFFEAVHADINKCVVDGKTVYTESACPENTAQKLELKDFSILHHEDSTAPSNNKNSMPTEPKCMCQMPTGTHKTTLPSHRTVIEYTFIDAPCPTVGDKPDTTDGFIGHSFTNLPTNFVMLDFNASGHTVCATNNLDLNALISVHNDKHKLISFHTAVEEVAQQIGSKFKIDEKYVYFYK